MLTDEKLAIAQKHRWMPATTDPVFNYGYSGSLIRRSFYGLPPETNRNDAYVCLAPMPPSEDLIEWAELCCAIEAAKEEFTMVELGAGFGRWAIMGGVAARRAKLKTRLIAVEAEHEHFSMLRMHFEDNGFDPAEHRLVEAAVTDAEKEVIFVQGHSEEWWGQAILPTQDYGYGNWPRSQQAKIKGLPLSKIIERFEKIDFIDMDVQGAEADVVRGSLDAIATKVSRFHIGTHNSDVEVELRSLFTTIGFHCINDFSCHGVRETPFGTFQFDDGIQTWKNPRRR